MILKINGNPVVDSFKDITNDLTGKITDTANTVWESITTDENLIQLRETKLGELGLEHVQVYAKFLFNQTKEILDIIL